MRKEVERYTPGRSWLGVMLDKTFIFNLIFFVYFKRKLKFQNWVPGRNSLKYGENKENDVFTIDNTIALKKTFTISDF